MKSAECPGCWIGVDVETWSVAEKEEDRQGGVSGKSGGHVTMTEEPVV